jgi:aspartyl-tRNA(Asn)/glutamyl-tRNA(Gln) amidotransferase subunit B
VVIAEAVDAVLRDEAAAVGEYRSGKQQVYGYLVGRVMAHLQGKADARLVNEELRRRLD